MHHTATCICIKPRHFFYIFKPCYVGVFGGDPRGVSLALCTDGVNPFAHNRVVYSMWPIMLTLLNLPRRLRNLFTNILLVGIVPRNEGKEAKTLDPFLEVMVDKLLQISSSTLYDAYAGAPFQAKVSILLHVLDYPGIGKVMGVVGSGGIQGCAFCTLEGERSAVLRKTIYLQNRRFLLPSSSLRKDKVKYAPNINTYIYIYTPSISVTITVLRLVPVIIY